MLVASGGWVWVWGGSCPFRSDSDIIS